MHVMVNLFKWAGEDEGTGVKGVAVGLKLIIQPLVWQASLARYPFSVGLGRQGVNCRCRRP